MNAVRALEHFGSYSYTVSRSVLKYSALEMTEGFRVMGINAEFFESLSTWVLSCCKNEGNYYMCWQVQLALSLFKL